MTGSNDGFRPLHIAILTISDSRGPADDRSGDALCEAVAVAGHDLAARDLVPDDIYRIRAVVSAWIASPGIQAIITTGGTGFAARDSTPDALRPLFDVEIEGFGELFRALSHEEIGSSALQSRALAGLANRTVVACLPGSTGACHTGWHRILKAQLDVRHRPCNLAELVLLG